MDSCLAARLCHLWVSSTCPTALLRSACLGSGGRLQGMCFGAIDKFPWAAAVSTYLVTVESLYGRIALPRDLPGSSRLSSVKATLLPEPSQLRVRALGDVLCSQAAAQIYNAARWSQCTASPSTGYLPHGAFSLEVPSPSPNMPRGRRAKKKRALQRAPCVPQEESKGMC
jgi:hypothetical protein